MKTFLSVVALACLLILSSAAGAAPTGPLSTYLVEPCRFIDTRDANLQIFQEPGPFRADYERLYEIEGSCGVPYGARGVIINVTAIGATGAGHFAAYDPQATLSFPPKTSLLNFSKGQTIANGATVRLAEGVTSSGSADIAFFAHVQDEGTVDVIVDVVGYLR
jgi:hypothetical protein